MVALTFSRGKHSVFESGFSGFKDLQDNCLKGDSFDFT